MKVILEERIGEGLVVLFEIMPVLFYIVIRGRLMFLMPMNEVEIRSLLITLAKIQYGRRVQCVFAAVLESQSNHLKNAKG